MSRLRVILAVLLWSTGAQALPPESGRKMVETARRVLDVRYDFGGRLRAGRGIDCLGVVFLAAESIGRCGWKSFSVNPTQLVSRAELGKPVEGLSPVRSDALDLSKLEVGDVLMLVAPIENPAEGAIGTLDGAKVWVWHTGFYSGDGKWIVGDHFAGKVIETGLEQYLKDYAAEFTGVMVTRMEKAPAPLSCRKHRPMFGR
jgi:hypothetical protein